MSDAFITRRGGGGGLSVLGAVLHVNAPVGSTITLAKGGVTVKVLDASKGHTNAGDSSLADWYYSVSSSNYGEWTVTATKDAESASKTVTVNSNKQYDVAIAQKTIIDVNTMTLAELLAITRNVNTSRGYNPQLKDGYFYFGTLQATDVCGWQITRQIDVTDYNYLVFSGYRFGRQDSNADFGFGDSLTGTNASYICNIAKRTVTTDALGDTVLDISGISGSYYFGIIRSSANISPPLGMYVEKAYLANFL